MTKASRFHFSVKLYFTTLKQRIFLSNILLPEEKGLGK